MTLRIALYQPDIPQNTGTILRLCACLGVEAHIIEPTGFAFSDRLFRRSGMDYVGHVSVTRHDSWAKFEDWRTKAGHRLILLTTRGDTAYGIVSNGFLEEAFRTDHYRCTVVIHGADSWSYELSTTLVIPGLEAPFDHHDSNTLSRVAPPEPNPLALASED